MPSSISPLLRVTPNSNVCQGTLGLSVTPCPIVMKCAKVACDVYHFTISGGRGGCCYFYKGSCRSICVFYGSETNWLVVPGIRCGSARLVFAEVGSDGKTTGRVTEKITNKACGMKSDHAFALEPFSRLR